LRVPLQISPLLTISFHADFILSKTMSQSAESLLFRFTG
jgi:hypothetical protein